ncbi:MAG: IclR family transcriptional regulator [Acidimicrobiales bacterium]
MTDVHGDARRSGVAPPAASASATVGSDQRDGVGDRRESVVGRVSLIIDAFDAASPTLSLGQLTERTGLPKSTVHRMADQLVEVRWLERIPSGYRLGLRFFEVGGLVAGRNRLQERALPYLHDLQASTGHAVHLGMLEGFDVVILEKLWGHGAPSLPTRVGGRMPAHCTAAGKVLLAFAGEPVIEAAIAHGLPRRTGRTIVVPALFRQELATVRTTHWALESEEHVPGLRCVAAPIRGAGRAIAAVSVSGSVHKVDANRVVPLVRRCATDIWGQLFGRRGHEPPAGDATTHDSPLDIEQWRRWMEQVAGEWM